MKLIKLTDRSEFGWKTAIEYKQGAGLASDSDDEKRIKKLNVQQKES